MFKMVVNSVLILILLPSVSQARNGTGDGAGPGNPSSYYCADVGGKAEIFAEGGFHGNQTGVCSFVDGGMIEEWTLYRKASGGKPLAIDAFLRKKNHTRDTAPETWASNYCTELGGRIYQAVPTSRPSVLWQFCAFSDNSSIEAWTMYWGPTRYGELAKRLSSK